jgi:hypothetical protein
LVINGKNDTFCDALKLTWFELQRIEIEIYLPSIASKLILR